MGINARGTRGGDVLVDFFIAIAGKFILVVYKHGGYVRERIVEGAVG